MSLLSGRKYWLVIALVALIPVTVLHLGYTGSDFEFHVGSWREYAEVWRSGVLLPSWAPHANFQLGEARFLFYPPLSFMLGAMLSSLLPVVLVPSVFMWISLIIAGLAMFKLGEGFLQPSDRTLAALLYISSYYVMVCVLFRFAAAEVLCAAILPLVLCFYLRILRGGALRDGVLLGLCTAGLWLMDIPLAVDVFYGLAGCSVIDFVVRRNLRSLLVFGGGEVLSLFLSAWYLLPALIEKRNLVANVTLETYWRNYFLFHVPRGKSFALQFPFWIWTLAVSGLIIFYWLKERLGDDDENRILSRAFGSLAVITLFMQLPVSAPLWRYLPELKYGGFPFRFDLLLCCIAPIVLLLRFHSGSYRVFLIAIWAMAAFFPMSVRIMQARKHHETVTSTQVKEHIEEGYPGLLDYNPAGTDLDALASLHPDVIRSLGGNCAAKAMEWHSESRRFQTSSSSACVYQLGLIYFPNWRATLDGKTADIVHRSPEGLILADVPAGTHELLLRFRRPWAVSWGGALVSLLSCIAVTGMLVNIRRRSSTPLQA